MPRRDKLKDFEYRHSSVEANLDIGFAFQLRILRHQRGWTQQELAEKAGLKQATVSRLEGRDTFPSRSMIIKLARAFDIAYLFHFVDFDTFIEDCKDHSYERMRVAPFTASPDNPPPQTSSAPHQN